MDRQQLVEHMVASIRMFKDGLSIRGLEGLPKLYFEFSDMHQMKRAEIMIAESLSPRFIYRQQDVQRVDRDAVEFEIGGVMVVLRCITRLRTLTGIDQSYNETKFLTNNRF